MAKKTIEVEVGEIFLDRFMACHGPYGNERTADLDNNVRLIIGKNGNMKLKCKYLVRDCKCVNYESLGSDSEEERCPLIKLNIVKVEGIDS